FPHHHTVNVVDEFQISPLLGSVPTTATLPLTVLDTYYFFAPIPVRFLFFYEIHHPKTYFMETILPNIKHSLSVTLQHFYPLAGNLTWPQESTLPEILYESGDTVSLTLAESDYDDDYFYILSGNQSQDPSMLVPLIPKLRSRSSEKVGPLLAIQITLFPNKGISIGLAINHIVADGRTITHFIKSWASICRLDGDTSLIIDSLPFYDRSSLKHLKKEMAAQLILGMEHLLGITKDKFNNIIMHNYAHQQIVPVNKVRATFTMLSPDIKKLKQLVLSKENEILHLSSLVVTCAYVWVCLIKARESSSDNDSNVSDMDYFFLPADFRTRLKPPLPLTYFGNCVDSIFVATKTSSLTGADGMVFAAKLISNAILKMNIYDIKVDTTKLPQDRVTSISSSPKFGVYETDYGWGKPKKVECISNEDSITISDCPNVEGGFEIGFTRNKIEMDAFDSLFANSLAALY
ncbi:Anthocyanidin 3-O-glucoside 6''-O-acyltransferase, partial [Thalictrum thalictroides]